MSKIVLLLGSNLGDRRAYIERSVAMIENRVGRVVDCTTIHQTEPWGYESPNLYANQIIEIQADVDDPISLLDTLQLIEKELGRVRSESSAVEGRYSDRTIDIDILYIDDLVIDHPRLSVPHPRITEREFVLDLLAELSSKE